jgi:protein-S-isoprenylcysteine O-methyltransferase Ste14
MSGPRGQKLDVGRLVSLSVFSLLLAASILAVCTDVIAPEPFTTTRIATLVQRVFLVFFYAFLIFLYLIRSAAKSTTRSFMTKTIAVFATFLPFSIPALSRPSDKAIVILVASLVTIIGMGITLYSLSMLGRSFSIIPQARSLVQTGPYRYVRHPIYLGELISILGIVLMRPSAGAIAIYCLLLALLIYRALQEEKLLAGIFPEYATYSITSARFIPGVF